MATNQYNTPQGKGMTETDPQETQEWLDTSFKKVTCMVSDEEFAELKKVYNCKVITESRLDNDEVAIVFAPRNKLEWPEIMSTLRLWK